MNETSLEPNEPSQVDSVLKAVLIWFAVIIGIRVLNEIPFKPVQENLMVLTAILLIYPPVIMAYFKKQSLEYLAYNKDQLIKDLTWFALISLAVFPVSSLVNHLFQVMVVGMSFQVSEQYSLETLFYYVLTQLILISIPEELFFRGYLQKCFYNRWAPRFNFFGGRVGMATVMLSLLFALSHSMILWHGWHILIFFPALLFSWLREKTGTIWAAAFFHWACNLFSYLVYLHYR